MKTCKVCAKPYRTGRIAFVAGAGGLKGARVCTPCAKGGALIVAAAPANRCACGAPAGLCAACSERLADKAKRGAADASKLAKALRLRARLYAGTSDEFTKGLIDGLDQAADFLEKGAW